jgi:hypothetical protein
MFLGLPDPDPYRGVPSLFVLIRILPSTGKNKINTLNSNFFFLLLNNFFILKTDVNVPTKVLTKKMWGKNFFCWHLESRKKRAGSGSEDPDQYQTSRMQYGTLTGAVSSSIKFYV